jgi:hypothetical protein
VAEGVVRDRAVAEVEEPGHESGVPGRSRSPAVDQQDRPLPRRPRRRSTLPVRAASWTVRSDVRTRPTASGWRQSPKATRPAGWGSDQRQEWMAEMISGMGSPSGRMAGC